MASELLGRNENRVNAAFTVAEGIMNMADAKRSDAEWRDQLSPEQYRILRQAGTEPPGSGVLLHNKEQGQYRCGACGAPLFDREHKYDSGSGWPSRSA